VDNFRPAVCFAAMEPTPQKLTTPASLLVDAILVIAFFVFMYTVVSSHVPTNDPKMTLLWGALCSACLSGVFWLCIQMFRVVLKAQRQDRARRR
jgi:RsiW-degrading membrane proteinase PrsW (M82 family)